MKHIKSLLTKLGLPEPDVDTIFALPEAEQEKFNPNDYLTKITTTVGEQLRNDPGFYTSLNKDNIPREFLRTLEAEQYGRAANIVRQNLLKGFGMTEKDFEDLGEDGKKIEVFSKAFAKRLSDGKVGDKELQQQLLAANQKLQELEVSFKEKEANLRSEFEAKSINDKIDFIILARLASIKNLKVPPKYIADNISQKLKSMYSFEVNGLEADLRQKANKNLKVLINNSSEELTLDKAIEQILISDDLLVKDRQKESNGTVVVDGNPHEGLVMSSHIQEKINKRLQEEKIK